MSSLFIIPAPIFKQRPLKNRVFPLFSDCDSDLRDVHWWLAVNGYACVGRGEPCVFYSAHRVVMARKLGYMPSEDETVDHRNRIKIDNRRDNLSLVDDYKSAQNKPRRSDNTSGNIGVYQRSDTLKWAADIQINGLRIRRSSFPTKEEAIIFVAETKKAKGFYTGELP